VSYSPTQRAMREASRTRKDHVGADPLELRQQLRQPVRCWNLRASGGGWCLVHKSQEGVHDRRECKALGCGYRGAA
jgi:hypothetical protein